ncbi:hypothetical protein OK074_1646 [Actinobacteria bacterium OK074]|nr:hypothetical protein OK074_1646 [Actinobacteria bacterium OK074]
MQFSMELNEFSLGDSGGRAKSAPYRPAQVLELAGVLLGVSVQAQVVGDVRGEQSCGVGCQQSEEFAYLRPQVRADRVVVPPCVQSDGAQDMQSDRLALRKSVRLAGLRGVHMPQRGGPVPLLPLVPFVLLGVFGRLFGGRRGRPGVPDGGGAGARILTMGAEDDLDDVPGGIRCELEQAQRVRPRIHGTVREAPGRGTVGGDVPPCRAGKRCAEGEDEQGVARRSRRQCRQLSCVSGLRRCQEEQSARTRIPVGGLFLAAVGLLRRFQDGLDSMLPVAGVGDEVFFGQPDGLGGVGGLGERGEVGRQPGDQAVGQQLGYDGPYVRCCGTLPFGGGEDAAQQRAQGGVDAGAAPVAASAMSHRIEGDLLAVGMADGDHAHGLRPPRRSATGDQRLGVHRPGRQRCLARRPRGLLHHRTQPRFVNVRAGPAGSAAVEADIAKRGQQSGRRGDADQARLPHTDHRRSAFDLPLLLSIASL